MNFLLTILFLLVIVFAVYRFIRMFTSNIVTANDDYFQQAGVRVDFKPGTITIKGKVYDVKKVTGINTVTQPGGGIRSTIGMVEISMDDFKKPIHRITISGGHGKAPEFSQRLCVAIRKAGGPDFY
ncbi:hypothetical protein [Mucilaginibacter paludis]|uniref:Uncharacterized protein n=1 Tax=Mucilaginibacter paludis DSM 18603 TaxID=714943 RepID=H1Y5M0_9SPHI|nr:hypothetical protein [Mucilaginibacter paludis]EHQ29796.1 hypothetical protein Mucpa_5728 [Mucilaginibacter paludis DSM 18603]